jgi:hypothetical protein
MIEVEPLSIRDAEASLPVSLRGSLAGEYFQLVSKSDRKGCKAFLNELLLSDDIDLLKIKYTGCLVIGRKSEVGMYFPDW